MMRYALGMLLAWSVWICTAAANVKPVWHEGRRYVRLEELAAVYGGELIPTPDNKRVVVKTRWAELAFHPDSRELRIGPTLVWLHEPMIRVRSSWAIRELDAVQIVDPVMRPAEYLPAAGSRVVVIDPGHGGLDTGARGKRGGEEKHAALDIARRLRNHLIAAGLKVYLTRENDRFIELEERCRLARRWRADLFVSIHLNSAASTTAEGIETYALAAAGAASTAGGEGGGALPGNRFDAANSLLGFHIHRTLVAQANAPDRGLKRSRFIVLRNAPCPAVLVECGFLSHAEEEQKLLRETYREDLARGIAKGILHYVGLARKTQRTIP